VLRRLCKRWKKDRLADTTTQGCTLRGRGRRGQKSFVDRDYNSVSEVYFSVLQQLEIAVSYIEEHLSELRRDNIGCIEASIMKEHQRVFITWLMDKEIAIEDMTMKMLAFHPSSFVTS
jgi:hypothetical protein